MTMIGWEDRHSILYKHTETIVGVQVTLWQLKLAGENDSLAYAHVFQKLLLRQHIAS
jgi:hypothetical protein